MCLSSESTLPILRISSERQHKQRMKPHNGPSANETHKYLKVGKMSCRSVASPKTKINAAPIQPKAKIPQTSMRISTTNFLRFNRLSLTLAEIISRVPPNARAEPQPRATGIAEEK